MLLKRWLRIPSEETTFARRGFRCANRETQARLERVGEGFLYGYHAALDDSEINDLVARLERMDLEFRGFAYEGAAMALDLLDQLKSWRTSRVQEFLSGAGDRHVYMVHVGIGWSMMRLPFRKDRRIARLDPLLRWLTLDGCGFHEGYFHWPRYSDGRSRPKWLEGYGLRAFDQGLGRSLWFVAGADPEWITATIASFPDHRRADLWSGIGLACSYAGGAETNAIGSLRYAAGTYRDHLAQGAVFAAGARRRGGNPAAHTDLVCRVLCGISAEEAAELSSETVAQAKEDYEPAYEVWRRLIRKRFQEQPGNRVRNERQDLSSRGRSSGCREGNLYVQ